MMIIVHRLQDEPDRLIASETVKQASRRAGGSVAARARLRGVSKALFR
jgi:hypothetical protein